LSLSKIKHPQVLGIIELPLEDDYKLGFVTEYFSNNLENVLQNK